ncbi:hypothetical protein KSP39_PZI013467 [Platanthera zijinensis]|uniref:Uncharacterized protein n=1 Tax=Platanthera zijinensis TaxID=2320716 RepID=A0AAP0BBK4_9ASPA
MLELAPPELAHQSACSLARAAELGHFTTRKLLETTEALRVVSKKVIDLGMQSVRWKDFEAAEVEAAKKLSECEEKFAASQAELETAQVRTAVMETRLVAAEERANSALLPGVQRQEDDPQWAVKRSRVLWEESKYPDRKINSSPPLPSRLSPERIAGKRDEKRGRARVAAYSCSSNGRRRSEAFPAFCFRLLLGFHGRKRRRCRAWKFERREGGVSFAGAAFEASPCAAGFGSQRRSSLLRWCPRRNIGQKPNRPARPHQASHAGQDIVASFGAAVAGATGGWEGSFGTGGGRRGWKRRFPAAFAPPAPKVFSNKDGELSVVGRLFAGACAGMTSTFVTYPLDVLRLRLAVETGSRTMSQIALSMLREEGLSSFYGGLGPSLIGIAPYIAVNFCIFDL